MSNLIDLGGGHTLTPFTWRDPNKVAGYIEEHPDARDPSQQCRGAVDLDTYEGAVGDTWHVEQAEPLTLSPSLLCRVCGNHGFVRDGKWVPA